MVVRQKSDEKEYNLFMEALSKSNPHDIKVVERTDHLIFDGEIVEQTEDTMTLLNMYIDDLETNLNKTRIKGLVRDLYQEACEVA